MEIYLLDVGGTKYGDCLLIVRGQRKILIDAAHEGDFDSITEQLARILGQQPPFEFDLIVVTHCHSDHIGCMPRLVSEGVITAGTALVADEKLGFGRDIDGGSPIDAVQSPALRKVLLALQEEPADDLGDAALAQFIEDAATLEEKYSDMLNALHDAGTNVVRYNENEQPNVRAIEIAFADFGFKVLGPTSEHLAICAAAIAGSADSAADALGSDGIMADDAASLVSAYRRGVDVLSRQGLALSSDAAIEDRPGIGAAKNDQSIVIRVKADGWRALLTGDMQFAQPEVGDLGPFMTALRAVIVADGRYDFVKLAHHSSYNGFDSEVMGDWSTTKLYAHTGGLRDSTHPDEGVLGLLEEHSATIQFARTDRNGLIAVRKDGTQLKLIPERGELNDFSKNRVRRRRRDDPVAASTRLEVGSEPLVSEHGDEFVQVVARVPHVDTTVTITIQVQPGEKKKTVAPAGKTNRGGEGPGPNLPERIEPPGGDGAVKLGGGRAIAPRLLFVSRRDQLIKNVGATEATAALAAISAAGQTLLELPSTTITVAGAVALVRAKLAADQYAGVVLVGGYDVVPAARLDVLDAKLRSTLTKLGLIDRDSDQFVVWSDSLYGDMDGDTVAELPVSRIPDGRRADVLLAALQAPIAPRTVRGGLRNKYRPFAEPVYHKISNTRAKRILVSYPTSPDSLKPSDDLSGDAYFMLHGSDMDATRYWGENAPRSLCEGIDVFNVPKRAPGAIVFAGCCWGALIASPCAAKLRAGVELRPRGPESSIAIAYLQAGALAFVGCTGTHYSPLEKHPTAGLDFFGKPIHDHFWSSINTGRAPAQALFDAQVAFAKKMPHGPDDPFSRAVEMKLLREFTVLGLGW